MERNGLSTADALIRIVCNVSHDCDRPISRYVINDIKDHDSLNSVYIKDVIYSTLEGEFQHATVDRGETA